MRQQEDDSDQSLRARAKIKGISSVKKALLVEEVGKLVVVLLDGVTAPPPVAAAAAIDAIEEEQVGTLAVASIPVVAL